MFNPLLLDASKLKDADLENKITDLNKKYHMAARLGYGSGCDQILMALDYYKEEIARRQKEAMQKLIKKQDKDLDDLINVD